MLMCKMFAWTTRLHSSQVYRGVAGACGSAVQLSEFFSMDILFSSPIISVWGWDCSMPLPILSVSIVLIIVALMVCSDFSLWFCQY